MLKQAKETNWKHKFEKPQNENICLTNLNVEINGNFPFWHLEIATKMARRVIE